jgi:glycosyltransferase involved in cell wall biosynthesis
MRVLVVTNMTPDEAAPARGSFVRDQVEALRREGVDAVLHSFPVGSSRYLPAVRAIRKELRAGGFDLVHAHYGLVGWCAKLAGASPLLVTFHGTDVRHPVSGPLSRRLAPRVDLVAPVSRELFERRVGMRGLPRRLGRAAILPCGADLHRFQPIDRGEARSRLGLDPKARLILFPASPSRAVKRHDRAAQVARLAGAELISAGDVDSEQMPLWVNAASAVLVPSDYEGFGLAAVEALACDVPVLSTAVGIAPALLAGIEGCLCGDFDAGTWAQAVTRHLDGGGSVDGRRRASWFSAEAMAKRVLVAYDHLIQAPGESAADLA